MNAQEQAVAIFVAGVIIGLIGVIWNMVREQAKIQAHALEKKASVEALKETKEYFRSVNERQYAEFQSQITQLTAKQDREIDWLKEEMQRFTDALAEMRRENNAGQNNIMRTLQDLASVLRVNQT